MESNQLKFLLELLDCCDYRSSLSAAAFKGLKDKEQICQYLGKDGLVDFSREIDVLKITPRGSTLLKLPIDQVPLSAIELRVLEKISKASEKIVPSKISISSVNALELDKILQSFHEQGLVEVETKLKRTKPEVWLTQRGQEYLDLVNDYFQSLRKSQSSQITKPYTIYQPNDDEILQIIQDLDRHLGTENHLPIFYLRQNLQPPLSREQLDQVLYHLQRNNQIELNPLSEVAAYTPEQVAAGIPQATGEPLFFIVFKL